MRRNRKKRVFLPNQIAAPGVRGSCQCRLQAWPPGRGVTHAACRAASQVNIANLARPSRRKWDGQAAAMRSSTDQGDAPPVPFLAPAVGLNRLRQFRQLGARQTALRHYRDLTSARCPGMQAALQASYVMIRVLRGAR
jgi:hypothetical protein